MQPSRKNRVVCLCGERASNIYTCAVLLEAGIEVAGLCIAEQRWAGVPKGYLKSQLRDGGLGRMAGQVLGRLFYNLTGNQKKDQAIERRLYRPGAVQETLKALADRTHRTDDYARPETMQWIAERQPDILVVHTPYWVGKRVRALAGAGLVIGGHPGLTPLYRGSAPAFWALHNGRPQDVGYTVFFLDSGVDTGDVIRQGRIEPEEGDSYVTLQWKAMIRQAQVMAEVIADLDRGVNIPRRPHESIPPDSHFSVPTLLSFCQKLCLE